MDPKQIQAESRCFKRMRKMQKKKTKKKRDENETSATIKK
jgi:hypothetical protein